MSVRCPYCQHQMELKGAHAGRFTPKCPACKRKFVLLIPEDASMPPLVGEMPQPAAAAPVQIGHDSMAGLSHAGLTAAGVNAMSATAGPPVATNVAAALTGNATATLPPTVTAPPPPSAPAIAAGATIPPVNVTMPKLTVPPGSSTQPQVGLAGPPGDMPVGDSKPPGPRTVVKETYVDHGPSLSGSLGGYDIVQKLGEGGMGAVYLARQVSLDRPVALKVLSPQLASDPEFVARFTREAYAAAQLAHHNVVQIHDIGFDRDTNFFSMEFVPGQTLEKLVNHEGKLDPEVAVGYVLQAARGLRFAHEHGLIHRDVKPDNLLLNEQGIVKVADLGLVKQAGKTEITHKPGSRPGAAPAAQGKTQLNISMGTPAYMPPEQARDAAHVDQRADIYSLGCTLYDLLTGTPPFNGKTAVEVITKHQTAPVVPPDRVARHVSPELSQVVMKMMAKRPEDRYPTMAEVVESLEGILGVESGKTFSPKEEHVRVLEGAVEQFNGSKWAKLRRNGIYGFYGACALGAIVCALPQVGKPFWAGAFVGFAVLATVFYQLLIGVTRKTHLFTAVRQFAFGARLADWLKFLAAAAVVVLLLVAFNLHWSWLIAAVVAGLAAAAFHFTIDRLVDAERKTPLGHVEGMLKKMRLRGLDEAALRQFVCKYSGERWEEMYESLFGYEAKRAARRSWGASERGRNRRRFGAWRDVIIDWIDRRMLARKEDRERKLLARIEAKALAAKGMDQASANRKAKQTAERMVDKGARVKESAERRMMMTALPTTSGRTMMFDGVRPLASWADGFEEDEADAKRKRDRDGERVHESYFKRRFGTPLDFVLGPQVRILLGAILIAMFALWMKQSGGVVVSRDGQDLVSVSDAVETAKSTKIDKIKDVKLNLRVKEPAKQWKLPMVPQKVCDVAGTFNGGIAGALLLLSGFFCGKRLGILVLAGAAIALLAYRYPIPVVEGHRWIAAGIGVAVAAMGIMLFRRTAAD